MSEGGVPIAANEVRNDQPRFNPVGLMFFGMTATVLLMMCFVWENLGNPWGPLPSALAAWVLFIIHIVLIRSRLSAMDPLVWIPVFMLLFYFGTPIAVDLMGFSEYGEAFGPVPKLTIGFVINLMSFAAFFFGVHLSGIADCSRPTTYFPEVTRSLIPAALAMGVVGYVMLLIGVAIAGPGILFGSYVDLRMAEASGKVTTSWYNVGTILVPATCMALLASYDKSKGWIPPFVMAAMAPVLLLLVATGDRGGLAAQIMALGWVFTQRLRRVSATVATVGFVLALILMPMLKEYRNYRDVQDSSQLSSYELIAATFYEMGSSGLIFAWTVDAVPRTRPYDYGASIALPVVYLVPWVGRAVPGLGEYALDHNQNYWISQFIDPASYAVKGASHGFTMTGVWYSNFGIAGVYIFGAGIGWAAGRLRNMGRENSIRILASGLSVVFMALVIRNSLGTPLRYVVWPFGMILICYLLTPRKVKRTEIVGNEMLPRSTI